MYKCDSVWILELCCIGGIMRFINVGRTQYEVTARNAWPITVFCDGTSVPDKGKSWCAEHSDSKASFPNAKQLADVFK